MFVTQYRNAVTYESPLLYRINSTILKGGGGGGGGGGFCFCGLASVMCNKRTFFEHFSFAERLVVCKAWHLRSDASVTAHWQQARE